MSAADGDERAFSVLVRRHKEVLFRFAWRYVGDPDNAYEIVQSSFLSAWDARRRYDPARPFAAWLRAIVFNKCRDYSRRTAVRRLLMIPAASHVTEAVADPQRSPEAEWIAREEVDALDKAIAALPRALKEPLILTVFVGLSQAEAGHELGMSAKAIETRLYRARRVLTETINKPD